MFFEFYCKHFTDRILSLSFIVSILLTEFYKFVFEVAVSIDSHAKLRQNFLKTIIFFSLIISATIFLPTPLSLYWVRHNLDELWEFSDRKSSSVWFPFQQYTKYTKNAN